MTTSKMANVINESMPLIMQTNITCYVNFKCTLSMFSSDM